MLTTTPSNRRLTHGVAEMPQPRTDDLKVIDLPPGRLRLRAGPDDGERGRILFFTGIRYERLADPVLPPPGPAREERGAPASAPGP